MQCRRYGPLRPNIRQCEPARGIGYFGGPLPRLLGSFDPRAGVHVAASLETDPQLGVIRIVVVVPPARGAERAAGPAPMAVETTAGLARLGDPV